MPVQNAHLSQPQRELQNLPYRNQGICSSPQSWERAASQHQTFHLIDSTEETSLEKSQVGPSLQEERASCLVSLAWIRPHQCVIHYWCILPTLLLKLDPQHIFLASGKGAVSVCPSTTITYITPTTGHQDTGCGSLQPSANRLGQKKRHLLQVSQPLLLLHVSIAFSHCGLRTTLRRGDRTRVFWGTWWKNKSYKLFQGHFQLDTWNRCFPQPQGCFKHWNRCSHSLENPLPWKRSWIKTSLWAVWYSLRVILQWARVCTRDPQSFLPIKVLLQVYDSSQCVLKWSRWGFFQHPWALGPATKTGLTSHS